MCRTSSLVRATSHSSAELADHTGAAGPHASRHGAWAAPAQPRARQAAATVAFTLNRAPGRIEFLPRAGGSRIALPEGTAAPPPTPTPAVASTMRRPEAHPGTQPEAARLGNPSFVWGRGQDRRLAIIERHARLNDRRVLDLGCGVGEYVRAFSRRGAIALGCDIEVP